MQNSLLLWNFMCFWSSFASYLIINLSAQTNIMIKANNPALKSWVEVAEGSDFPIQNLPIGIFKYQDENARAGVAIGAHLLDLGAVAEAGFFDDLGLDPRVFNIHVLNEYLMYNRDMWRQTRDRISDLLNIESDAFNQEQRETFLFKQDEVAMLMPVQIGDYTDFYASKEHATNVGTMFRDPENALLPNWLHLPVGYHGRASSIVVSGSEIHRPMGQTRPDAEKPPIYGPSRLLDFELEVGYITGQGKELGDRIGTEEADEYIYGLVLFNDLSARDIQKWEYVPLGPFLGKNFASVISPWIVSLDALEPFRVAAPPREKEILPYLQYKGKGSIDLNLEVKIAADGFAPSTICQSNFKYMYWTMQQQLAHHTVNGCNINAGDMLASGTISGSSPDSYGSMLELSWRGTKPLKMPDGSERKFINDGDQVILSGSAENSDVRIGFGECSMTLLPAKES